MRIVIETDGNANNTTVEFNGVKKPIIDLYITIRQGKGLKSQVCELIPDGKGGQKKFFYTLFNEDFKKYDEFNPVKKEN